MLFFLTTQIQFPSTQVVQANHLHSCTHSHTHRHIYLILSLLVFYMLSYYVVLSGDSQRTTCLYLANNGIKQVCTCWEVVHNFLIPNNREAESGGFLRRPVLSTEHVLGQPGYTEKPCLKEKHVILYLAIINFFK